VGGLQRSIKCWPFSTNQDNKKTPLDKEDNQHEHKQGLNLLLFLLPPPLFSLLYGLENL